LGRAPGTDPATAAALRRGHGANDTFPEQVLELFGFLGRSSPPDTPTRTCMLCRPVAGGPEPGSAPGDLPGDLDPGPLDLLGAARRPARAPLRFRPAVRQRRRRHRSAAVQGEFPALRGALRA